MLEEVGARAATGRAGPSPGTSPHWPTTCGNANNDLVPRQDSSLRRTVEETDAHHFLTCRPVLDCRWCYRSDLVRCLPVYCRVWLSDCGLGTVLARRACCKNLMFSSRHPQPGYPQAGYSVTVMPVQLHPGVRRPQGRCHDLQPPDSDGSVRSATVHAGPPIDRRHGTGRVHVMWVRRARPPHRRDGDDTIHGKGGADTLESRPGLSTMSRAAPVRATDAI